MNTPVTRMLAAELKRRVAFLVPVGLFIAATSLPCSGEAAGGKAIPLNVGGMALSAGLLLIYLLGRFRPRPWIFLLDALWWMGLQADSIYPVLTGASHPAWLALTPLSVYLSWLSIQQYRRFADAVPTP